VEEAEVQAQLEVLVLLVRAQPAAPLVEEDDALLHGELAVVHDVPAAEVLAVEQRGEARLGGGAGAFLVARGGGGRQQPGAARGQHGGEQLVHARLSLSGPGGRNRWADSSAGGGGRAGRPGGGPRGGAPPGGGGD